MKIDLTTKNIELTPSIREHVKRRLGFALGARADQIRLVEIMLSDVNGPKGGQDKRCRILIHLDGKPDIVVEDYQTSVKAVVDRAAAKASHSLARRLAKLRDHYQLVRTKKVHMA